MYKSQVLVIFLSHFPLLAYKQNIYNVLMFISRIRNIFIFSKCEALVKIDYTIKTLLQSVKLKTCENISFMKSIKPAISKFKI